MEVNVLGLLGWLNNTRIQFNNAVVLEVRLFAPRDTNCLVFIGNHLH